MPSPVEVSGNGHKHGRSRAPTRPEEESKERKEKRGGAFLEKDEKEDAQREGESAKG
jgi:hypothetical protein